MNYIDKQSVNLFKEYFTYIEGKLFWIKSPNQAVKVGSRARLEIYTMENMQG